MEQTPQLKMVPGKRWGTKKYFSSYYPFIFSFTFSFSFLFLSQNVLTCFAEIDLRPEEEWATVGSDLDRQLLPERSVPLLILPERKIQILSHKHLGQWWWLSW